MKKAITRRCKSILVNSAMAELTSIHRLGQIKIKKKKFKGKIQRKEIVNNFPIDIKRE